MTFGVEASPGCTASTRHTDIYTECKDFVDYLDLSSYPNATLEPPLFFLFSAVR